MTAIKVMPVLALMVAWTPADIGGLKCTQNEKFVALDVPKATDCPRKEDNMCSYSTVRANS